MLSRSNSDRAKLESAQREHFLGYCPLGKGRVDVPKILDLLEKSKIRAMIMVELDPSPVMPMKPFETAEISQAYLQKMGYKFRS